MTGEDFVSSFLLTLSILTSRSHWHISLDQWQCTQCYKMKWIKQPRNLRRGSKRSDISLTWSIIDKVRTAGAIWQQMQQYFVSFIILKSWKIEWQICVLDVIYQEINCFSLRRKTYSKLLEVRNYCLISI